MQGESVKRSLWVLTFGVFLSGGGVGYLIWKIPPSRVATILLLALIGMFIHLVSSLIMYGLCKKGVFESRRFILKRKFRNGAILALLVVALLALQRHFGIL